MLCHLHTEWDSYQMNSTMYSQTFNLIKYIGWEWDAKYCLEEEELNNELILIVFKSLCVCIGFG